MSSSTTQASSVLGEGLFAVADRFMADQLEGAALQSLSQTSNPPLATTGSALISPSPPPRPTADH